MNNFQALARMADCFSSTWNRSAYRLGARESRRFEYRPGSHGHHQRGPAR